MIKRKKIAFIVSSPMTITSFLLSHIKSLSLEYDVYVIANCESEVSIPNAKEVINVRIERDIKLFYDLKAVLKLVKVLKKYKFCSVHSVTPKAGLLCMLASFFCRVPFRYHTFTGQVWATKSGLSRIGLKFLDKLIFTLSTHSLVDSSSQQSFLIQEKVINRRKSTVLGKGSISGVDLSRFKFSLTDRMDIRDKLGIPEDSICLLFLGRLCQDKGLDELLIVFKELSSKFDDIYLLLVGPNEGQYTVDYFASLDEPRLRYIGPTDSPASYMSTADLFLLPSHREGFGSVVLEAAACKLPTVASNIYGLSDAVVDGRSGLLHEVQNVKDMEEKIAMLIENKEYLSKLSDYAFNRVKVDFDSEYLSSCLVSFYKNDLSQG
ncbi:glycosyltransferase [Vibrio coralliirubri]|uniref:glycosyltransferase n=1 Tax=Vibrio coralliirubri TaxID=1516159 RepID=UPI00069A5B0D|nr:glycosyltransferase [Vibrio coralliirubri]